MSLPFMVILGIVYRLLYHIVQSKQTETLGEPTKVGRLNWDFKTKIGYLPPCFGCVRDKVTEKSAYQVRVRTHPPNLRVPWLGALM